MDTTFERIIAPMARARFLADHWMRRAVHLRNPDRSFHDLFGWDALDAVLNAPDLAFPKVKVSRNDRPAPPERFTVDAGGTRLVNGAAVLGLFNEGASIGITAADTHWPPLRGVIACMFDTFLESVHTNVYCSPANTQGFQCHFDLHEVFVLQIDGEKHWRVFDETVEAPVTSWKPDDAPAASTAPYLDVVLRKGDVLYVPRGHWHYAVAQDTASLHITVGITCRKTSSFVDWLAGEMRADPLWRKNLPPMGDAACGGRLAVPAEWRACVAQLSAALRRRLDGDDVAEEFCRAMLRDTSPLAHVSLAAGSHAVPVDETVFERPAGRRHFFDRTDTGVVLTSGSCEIELDEPEVPFFERMFAAEAFTGEEARAWRGGDGEGVAEVLAQLVGSGLLVAKRR